MKTCEHCGEKYPKRPKEAHWQYRERRFCSKSCATKHRNGRVPDSEFKARYRQVTHPDGSKALEHRWVVEQAIGRKLNSDEQVHHINENRLDNRLENLEVVSPAEHGERHTWHPTQKVCGRCSATFTPHKTKRARAKYCKACAMEWRAEQRGSKMPLAKLDEKKVTEIKGLIQQGMVQRDIAEVYGVTPTVISGINRGHIWKHVE